MQGEVPAGPGVLSWCEIDHAALRANVAQFRRCVGERARLGIAVKSEAYGHGLAPCARTCLEAGADWLVVNDVEEAQALRRAGIEAPIYVCGPVPPARAREVVETGARVVLYDEALAEALDAAGRAHGRRVPVHVKIETGTQRQGLPLDDALALGRRVAASDGLRIEGVTTHYADIEDTTNHTFARRQLEGIEAAAHGFREAGLEVPMVHSANSAATILWSETHGDLARVGIAAYGLWPSTETFATAIQVHAHDGGGFPPELHPVMSWRARLAQVKDVPTGAFVGYGRTFRTTHPSRIAVLPVGYYEGYDRRLSNVAHVLIDGVRAPVCGRVCMNMTMVDVTHVPGATRGAVATLLGRDGDEEVSADDLADWMGTINYEVVSRIHPEQPRYHV